MVWSIHFFFLTALDELAIPKCMSELKDKKAQLWSRNTDNIASFLVLPIEILCSSLISEIFPAPSF